MVTFLKGYYERTRSDKAGSLLGEMKILEDGKVTLPGTWQEWLFSFKQVYFDQSHYEWDKHWHIDTRKDEYHPYIEAIALKRKDAFSWDVFFNDFENQEECYRLFPNELHDMEKTFGVFLLNEAETNVQRLFNEWVEFVLTPFSGKNLNRLSGCVLGVSASHNTAFTKLAKMKVI
jgi:hypothetical protein